MSAEPINVISIDNKDSKRAQRINAKLNIKKLPFNITQDNFCLRYSEMFRDMKPLFKYKKEDQALKWCLSTEKKNEGFFINI